MVEPLRHRQTKGAATDMPGLLPLRHIPTLPNPFLRGALPEVGFGVAMSHRAAEPEGRLWVGRRATALGSGGITPIRAAPANGLVRAICNVSNRSSCRRAGMLRAA